MKDVLVISLLFVIAPKKGLNENEKNLFVTMSTMSTTFSSRCFLYLSEKMWTMKYASI